MGDIVGLVLLDGTSVPGLEAIVVVGELGAPIIGE